MDLVNSGLYDGLRNRLRTTIFTIKEMESMFKYFNDDESNYVNVSELEKVLRVGPYVLELTFMDGTVENLEYDNLYDIQVDYEDINEFLMGDA